MTPGFAGKMLFVDLTAGKIAEEHPVESLYRQFIGGTGLGAAVLYERMKPGANPLGPDAMLGFATGPLTGAGVAGSGRFTVVGKSPVTGAWADSNSGGFWGPELKQAGYDAVFFSGISPKPVYLFITDGRAELRDASHLWGKDTADTENKLQTELGDAALKVACIGPAGEALSLMAGIVNEKGRIAARGGLGAVMGAKKLKAIVVRGDKKNKVAVADKAGLSEVNRDFVKNIRDSRFHKMIGVSGTGTGTSFLLSIGDCPTKNWNSTGLESMPTAVKLNSPNMDPYKLSGYGCHGCVIRCGAMIRVGQGPFATKGEVHRPEYESIAALGAMCLNDNLESIVKANDLCNLYGLDTIAVGGAIAFAMECYEKGVISREQADGIELTWGNGEVVVALTEKIGRREGFGAVLADGVKKAAERLGRGAEEFAMHVGGHRLPYHDPRLSPALGTSYIADAQPACHMDIQGSALLERGVNLGTDLALAAPKVELFGDYDRRGPIYSTGSEYYQILSSSGMCALYAIGFAVPVVELLNPVTGWNLTWPEALKIGKRILTLRQAFNAREGVKPADFKFPKRFDPPLAVGPAAGKTVDFETLRKEYFQSMGWDIATGRPYPETLKELGLEDLV